MSQERIKTCLLGGGLHIVEDAVSERWTSCHSPKSLRALDKSVALPGSKGMVVVFEEYLLRRLADGLCLRDSSLSFQASKS